MYETSMIQQLSIKLGDSCLIWRVIVVLGWGHSSNETWLGNISGWSKMITNIARYQVVSNTSPFVPCCSECDVFSMMICVTFLIASWSACGVGHVHWYEIWSETTHFDSASEVRDGLQHRDAAYRWELSMSIAGWLSTKHSPREHLFSWSICCAILVSLNSGAASVLPFHPICPTAQVCRVDDRIDANFDERTTIEVGRETGGETTARFTWFVERNP